MNNEPDNTILASPDKQNGHVIVELYGFMKSFYFNYLGIYSIDLKKSTKIKAHQSALSFLELSPTGNKLASSSEKVEFFKEFFDKLRFSREL